MQCCSPFSLFLYCLLQLELVEKPQDVTVREGESVTFACRVHCLLAPPPPAADLQVTWFFMGRPLDPDPVYSVCQDEVGGHTLRLAEAWAEDAGLYTVRVCMQGVSEGTPPRAVVEASAILNVEGKPCFPAANGADNTMEIHR